MPAYKKYLPLIGLLLVVTLAGCGSSSSSPQRLPAPGGSPAEDINETYQQGAHSFQLDFEGSCFACHAVEGSELLKSVAGSGSPEYNVCVSCHSTSSDTIADLPASHSIFIADYAATNNACTQCHDPHAGTKFEQTGAAAITTQWTQSGHGNAESAAFTSTSISGADCLKCHSGSVFAQTLSAVAASDVDISGGPQVIGCGACHDLLATNNAEAFELGALRQIDSVSFPSGVAVGIDAANNLCLTCHQGRSSTPTVNERIAAGNLAFSNIHYAAAGAVLFGGAVQGGYEYAGQTYRGRNAFTPHTQLGEPGLVTCTGCHFDGDNFDHSFPLPDLAACVDCHGGDSFETLDGSPLINSEQIGQFKDRLRELLMDSGVTVSDGYPYFSNISTAQQLRAAYNWQFADKDKGGYIHNGVYIRQLLFDSITDMNGEPAFPRP